LSIFSGQRVAARDSAATAPDVASVSARAAPAVSAMGLDWAFA